MNKPKKLIDWATVPMGMKTSSNGTFVKCRNGIASVLYVWEEKGTRAHLAGIDIKYLRLAPADQQPWLLYEEGITVIPEWAEIEYVTTVADIYGETTRISSNENSYKDISPRFFTERPICIYKLGNSEGKLFKDGWTDNPDEVTE